MSTPKHIQSRRGRPKRVLLAIVVFMAMCFGVSSIGTSTEEPTQTEVTASVTAEPAEEQAQDEADEPSSDDAADTATSNANDTATSDDAATTTSGAVPAAATETSFDLSTVPAYSGSATVEVNGGEPFFQASDLVSTSYESYSQLDSLGRCGVAVACVGTDLMPTEERGSIGMVKPSGWHTVRYDGLVDGNYLYNRCHLIGYQLTGENANERNLITGTRYMNVEGMEPYESQVAAYVESTGNHVLYRSTPVFEGQNLVATGVLLEAESVEDGGAGIKFCVWCYNVQPGVGIDYATGDSWLDGTVEAQAGAGNASGSTTGDATATSTTSGSDTTATTTTTSEKTYVLNTNTKKFHLPGCSSVNTMSEKNKKEYTGTRDEVIAQGYDPCKRCNP